MGVKGGVTVSDELIINKLLAAAEKVYMLFFHIYFSRELPEHLPSRKKARKAIKDLSELFISKDGVRQALEIFENQKTSVSDTELNRILAVELEYLHEKAKQLGRAPICAEIPENIAFKLWYHLKCWDNILNFAQIPLLSSQKLNEAQHRFMLDTATINFLDDYTKAKFSKNLLTELEKICDNARSLGRSPIKEEIPLNVFRSINKISGSWHAMLSAMGIPIPDQKTERRISRNILSKRQKNKVSG